MIDCIPDNQSPDKTVLENGIDVHLMKSTLKQRKQTYRITY